ncbi:hypothetical protein BGW80DRAFT_1435531 [Lactifluus volemus]|nr:hypothetical protein BGW80DRAFT_1435531 [Lactifluus volemus]
MADDSLTSKGLQPYAFQVGGHKGMQSTEDGTLLIKPAKHLEHQFYQSALADPALAPLRPWVPTYLGTLRLEGQHTAEGFRVIDGIPESEKDECIFIRIPKAKYPRHKLGTVLYDEDAPPDKKERMRNSARRTTSGETGIRLTGFQVFGNKMSQPIVVPKAYGKSISSSELPTGIARFFPVGDSMTLGAQSYVGLPSTLLLPILRSIRKSVQELRDILSTIELRLVGSSLLLFTKGTGTARRWEDQRIEEEKHEYADIEVDGVQDEEGVEEEEEEEVSEDDSEDDGNNLPCVVRLIDFAHTRLKRGQGPDSGVLKGLDTVLNLLDGRIESLL